MSGSGTQAEAKILLDGLQASIDALSIWSAWPSWLIGIEGFTDMPSLDDYPARAPVWTPATQAEDRFSKEGR
jgi:hypothetical protein